MEYTEQVVVLGGHLEDILRVLVAAEGLATALDLQRGYTTMRSGTPSTLTNALRAQVDRVEGYLNQGDDNVVSEG